MKKRKKSNLTHIHKHVKHHARRIRQRWETPHTVIAVIVFLVVAFAILSYQQYASPRSEEASSNLVVRSRESDDTKATVTPASGEFGVVLGKATVDKDTETGCSGTYNFLYPITSNKSGTITFQRMRSDGEVIDAQPQTLYFSKAETKSVPYTWTVDKPYEFSGYSYIQILSPKPATSNYANFTFTYLCR